MQRNCILCIFFYSVIFYVNVIPVLNEYDELSGNLHKIILTKSTTNRTKKISLGK